MPHKSKKAFDIHRTLPNPHQRPALPTARLEGPGIPEKPSLWKRILVGGLIVLLGLAIVIGGWDMINLSRASQTVFGSSNLFNLVGSSGLKSQGGRTNVLLVGYSVDDPNHPGAGLTDAILVLSLSTKNRSGYMLSIPRDLYVRIPGFGYGKINEAYQDGGIKLLEQIIQTDFGLQTDYYALVNYAAVRDTVNALGGITVNIQSPDPRGLYDPNINSVDGGPLKLSNGTQKINGQTALNLTRARGDPAPDGRVSYGFPQSDFDRTQHQREILAAIKRKLSLALVLNPLKNGKLFQAVAKNIKTDSDLAAAKGLFSKFNSIPNSQLQSISLRNFNGKNLLVSYTTDGGEAALIPASGLNSYFDIQAAIDQLNQ